MPWDLLGQADGELACWHSLPGLSMPRRFARHRFEGDLMRRLLTVLLLGMSCATAAWGQGWTSRPVRVIFPASPGSLLDTYLRAVVSQVAESTGQSMIVEDRP